MNSEEVPVGKCEEHGIIYEDDLEYNFPERSRCHCGRYVQVKTVSIKRLAEHKQKKETNAVNEAPQ